MSWMLWSVIGYVMYDTYNNNVIMKVWDGVEVGGFRQWDGRRLKGHGICVSLCRHGRWSSLRRTEHIGKLASCVEDGVGMEGGVKNMARSSTHELDVGRYTNKDVSLHIQHVIDSK